MSRVLDVALALCAAFALSACAGSSRPPAPINPMEALGQQAKKVDFAIAETKRLIQRSRGAGYMADMYMRLGELYAERARYAWLTVYERAHANGQNSRAVEAPEARLLKSLAIATYDRVIREFPDADRNDEALFLMAHEYRELGQFTEMREAYEKLISTYPKSTHRTEAYLILGDTEFDKNNLDKAERYYNLVLAEPESHVHALARYKLGWVRINNDDCPAAVKLFEKILRDKNVANLKKTTIITQKSVNLSREPLVDIAYCFPEVYGEKVGASGYFRSLAQNSSDYMAAMRRAANRFFIKQMYAQAASALREVLGAAPADEDALETARKLYDNVVKSKIFLEAPADVEDIGRAFELHYHDPRIPDAQRNRMRDEFEIYSRDLATKMHGHAKDTKNPQHYAIAANAYEAYLRYFPTAKARGDMEENRAEALLAADLPFDTGQAFEKVAVATSNVDRRKQARINAISAYQQALEKSKLSRVQRVIAWAGIRKLGAQFITDNPADPKGVTVKLAIARSHYDAGDYARAAELFYSLARQYPTTEEGQIGAQLALDALRLEEDFEGLVTLGNRMLADTRLGDEKFRAQVKDIVAKTEQRQVAELTISSAGEHEDALVDYAKRHKGSGLGEQALYNSMLLAKDHGDIDRFYQLGEEFITTYTKSSRRTDVLSALATVASDRADYEQAAQFLDAVYEQNPSENGDKLFAATSIRAALGSKGAVEGIRKLRGGNKVDEMLMLLARSGDFAAIGELVQDKGINGPVADFMRGYLAYDRGDRERATTFLGEAARAKATQDAAREAVARARVLIGELSYESLNAKPTAADVAGILAEKSAQLTETDRAFAQAIESRNPTWAVAALARLAQAYERYASILKEAPLPADLSPDEKKQVEAALGAKADEASKRGAQLKALCAKRAKELVVFSDGARSCLGEGSFPDRLKMFAQTRSGKHGGDPPGVGPARQALVKSPKSGDALLAVAQAYLRAGDLATAILVLERAEEADGKQSELMNLRGVALQRAGDPDGAYAAFSKAVSLDGGNLRARQNLAAHYAFYGYVDKAKAELKRAGEAPTPSGDVAEHPELSALSRLGGDKK